MSEQEGGGLMSKMGNLLRQWKGNSADTRIEAAKEEPIDSPQQRLKRRFKDSGIDFSEGLDPKSLTVGDLIDVLDLYLETAQGSRSGAYQSIIRVAEV